jgi:hypothetical protein
MMAFFTGIWGKVAAFGAILLGLIFALLTLFKKGETAGANKVQVKTQAQVIKAQGQAADVNTQVQAKPVGQAAKDLEKDWTRPQ